MKVKELLEQKIDWWFISMLVKNEMDVGQLHPDIDSNQEDFFKKHLEQFGAHLVSTKNMGELLVIRIILPHENVDRLQHYLLSLGRARPAISTVRDAYPKDIEVALSGKAIKEEVVDHDEEDFENKLLKFMEGAHGWKSEMAINSLHPDEIAVDERSIFTIPVFIKNIDNPEKMDMILFRVKLNYETENKTVKMHAEALLQRDHQQDLNVGTREQNFSRRGPMKRTETGGPFKMTYWRSVRQIARDLVDYMVSWSEELRRKYEG